MEPDDTAADRDRRSEISLRELEVLQALVANGTAISAARRLDISQSAVSRRLAQLEERLGFKLFLRTNGRLVPTIEALSLSEQLAPVLETLARLDGARKVAILGDMLELGPDENRLHAEIAAYPALRDVALVHACGPRMRHLMDALPQAKRGIWSDSADDLCARAADLVRDSHFFSRPLAKSATSACAAASLVSSATGVSSSPARSTSAR